ncbi:hypothetical protein TGVAND_259840 [Toxoplasma gondii VAND]|uniref:Uncharacterized protein n=1 Tax=Toxoplasma gondii VAND TaxID=933077 RepID=A0A086QE16_TOXGO|nr:hypothetical protein TGVAND_259840 [Toxoplasma gondii VAND]
MTENTDDPETELQERLKEKVAAPSALLSRRLQSLKLRWRVRLLRPFVQGSRCSSRQLQRKGRLCWSSFARVVAFCATPRKAPSPLFPARAYATTRVVSSLSRMQRLPPCPLRLSLLRGKGQVTRRQEATQLRSRKRRHLRPFLSPRFSSCSLRPHRRISARLSLLLGLCRSRRSPRRRSPGPPDRLARLVI